MGKNIRRKPRRERGLLMRVVTIGGGILVLLGITVVFFTYSTLNPKHITTGLASSANRSASLKQPIEVANTSIELEIVDRKKNGAENTVLYDIEQQQQQSSIPPQTAEPKEVISENEIKEPVSINVISESGNLIPWSSILHDNMTEEELKIAVEKLKLYETQLMTYHTDLLARTEEYQKLRESTPNIMGNGLSKLMEGVNLTRIGIVSDSQVNAVIKGFNSLPTKAQDIIIANGYRVEVTDEDIEKLITGSGTNSWYGATAGTPLFVTLISIHQSEAEMVRTTIHEMGHAYDNSIGIVSCSTDFVNCYAAEGKTMYKTADVHDSSEWFSECLVYYCLDPALLKQTAPLSYQYMNNLFNKVLK